MVDAEKNKKCYNKEGDLVRGITFFGWIWKCGNVIDTWEYSGIELETDSR